MQTLSYGYKKPANPDTGDLWFPAMETNIQLLNDHTHNGTNSAPVSSTSQSAASGAWVATSNGTYRQLMTVPAGYSYDTCEVWVKRSTGERAYPTLEKVSTTTFYMYTNDNSLTYTVYYR